MADQRISDLTSITGAALDTANDVIPVVDASETGNAKNKKITIAELANAIDTDTGETNTASNVGTAGVGVFKQKTGADLEFKKINTASSKVTVTDDTGNNEIDIDIVPANINTADLNNNAGFIADITSESFEDLSDTPSYTGNSGKAFRVNGLENALEAYQPLTSVAFTDLTDVPSSYTGQGGKTLAINVGETAIEFITPSTTDEFVKCSANDTTAKYLEDAIVVSHGTNTTNPLQLSTLNDASDEDVQIQFDVSKVDLSNADNSTSAFINSAGAPVQSVNSLIGTVVLDPDDLDDTATTNKFTTAADISKLAGIEALADVTDATNVDAAGAVMNTDTSTAAMSFVVDEDNMASDSATKVPTQQSTKAYVDNSLAAQAETIVIALSDETTALSAATDVVTFRMPFAMTLTGVRASVNIAPTGSVLTVDINESGATVLSTKLTIDAGETTSTTAATPAVISDSALADDAEISIDIDGVGSTVAGAGLKVTLIGTRT